MQPAPHEMQPTSTQTPLGGGGGRACRTIKKYPNRRLYDTNTSNYITLAQIKELVLKAQAFVVLDAKTNENITRSILLQLILEEEGAGVPLFTEAMLCNIIRFYGHSMQNLMGSYLEKNIQLFMDMQQRMTATPTPNTSFTPEAWQHWMNMQSPMMQSMMGTYLEQSSAAMLQLQEQMQKNSDQMLAAMGFKRPSSTP